MKNESLLNDNEKLNSVDGVRGLACLMVLLSHLSLIFFPYLHGQKPSMIKSSFDAFIFKYPLGFFYSGSAAVYIFFCLSGFILTYACVSKGNILENSTKMLCSRYIRLAFPTFVSVLICSFTLITLKDHASGMNWISHWGDGVNLSISSITYNSIFSSIFLGDASYNWVIWTMQIELFGSFIIFFVTPVLNSMKYRWATCIVLSLAIAINYPSKIGFGYSAFLLGASIYYTPKIKNKYLVISLLVLGFYFGGYHYKQGAYEFLAKLELGMLRDKKIDGYVLYMLISGYLVVTACVKSKLLDFITANKLSSWLGKVSFSAYLLQMPVFFIVSPIFILFNGLLHAGYGLSALLSSVLCLISVYLLSIPFQKFIDMKSVTLSKKHSAFLFLSTRKNN